MALVNTLIPNASADVTGVFDAALAQVFTNAKSLKVTVDESSKLMEHPVEDGSLVTDHAVDNSTSAELSVVVGGLELRSLYQQIKQLWRNKTLLTIQTKTDSYPSMAIEAMPHSEDGSMFDAVMVAIKLKQVRFVTAQFGVLPASKVRKPELASTSEKGQQQTSPATPAQTTKVRGQSVLYGITR